MARLVCRVLTFVSLVSLAVGLAGCWQSTMCIRAVTCVTTCGGAVFNAGCGRCPSGMFDDIACRDAGPVADAGPSDAPPPPVDAGSPVDAPPGDECERSSQCVIRSATCCGNCGAATATDYVALPTDEVVAYATATCADEGSPACPRCAAANDPWLVAVCNGGECEGFDLREESLTECVSPSDCVLAARTCCDCGLLGVGETLAYNPARGTPAEYVCDLDVPSCPPCVPTFDGLTAGCVSGRCVVFGPD